MKYFFIGFMILIALLRNHQCKVTVGVITLQRIIRRLKFNCRTAESERRLQESKKLNFVRTQSLFNHTTCFVILH